MALPTAVMSRRGARSARPFFRRRHHLSVGHRCPARATAVPGNLRSNLGLRPYSLAGGRLDRLYGTALWETEPTWSSGGSTLAFVAHYGDEDELWLKNVKAGWKRVLFKASATGDRLAVTVKLNESIVPSGYAIYMIRAKSGHATRLPGDFIPMRPLDW